MICAFKTLQKKYMGKKIYIWNINRDSLGIFIRTIFSGVDIQGFVTLQGRYAGKMYLNHPIVLFDQIKREEDVVLLVSDEVPKSEINNLPHDKVLYWSAASGINQELQHCKIIIYGVGRGADILTELLAKEGLEAGLYCVTNRNDSMQFKGKDVIEASELANYEDCVVIISVLEDRYRGEILQTLSEFHGKIFLDMEYFISATTGGVANPLQNINLAIKNHKKVYLYSKKIMMSEFIEKFLYICGIQISGYVYDIEDKEQDINSIYDLVYEGIQDNFIILYEESIEQLIRGRENIEFAGFTLESANYTCFQWHTRAVERLLNKWKEYHDPLVGGSILYSEDKPGWKLYGRDEDDRIRILVLGGSTSSEEFYIENWVSKLYYKLMKNDIKVVIYNGAHAAYDIVDELLRMLRDGYILKPHIVISMSGVNNLYYKKCSNQFNPERLIGWVKSGMYCSGVSSDESLYHFWNRNEKLLRIVSEFFEAKFFAFLQPMNNTIQHMSLWENSVYGQERRITGAHDFSQLANDQDDYINLMRLFEHQDDMFYDVCHYTNKANRVIADRVYEEIIPVVEKIRKH